MLGTVHILMIRHGFYRSLPHREGGGGTGTVTGRKQELRRQLRVVRRNPHLIAALFLHQTGLQPTGDDYTSPLSADSTANRQRCEGNTSPPRHVSFTGLSSCP